MEVIKALPFIDLCFEIDIIFVVEKLIERLSSEQCDLSTLPVNCSVSRLI
jgi:hypothetical protein